MKTRTNPGKIALAVCSVAACLTVLHVTAQENAVPGTAVAAAQTEMQKWLADLDAPWQAAFKRDVSDAYTAENDRLRGQYVAALEAGITKASGAGDLNAAIVWRNEQKRFAEANGIPAQDDAADPLPVKQLRTTWRSQLPRIETDRATRARALHAKYDQVLAQAQAQLTKGNRLDDAILVKAKRDEVTAGWLAGLPSAPPVIAVKPTVPAKPPGTNHMAPVGSKKVREFEIEALVDGNTTLHITPQSMYWEVDGVGKVGMGREPTYINGEPWIPEWLPKVGDLDKSKPIEIPFGTIDLEYRLLALTEKREDTGIQRRTPTSGKARRGEFVVNIPDPESGQRWYKFVIRTKPR